jgi:hypothetical protein
MHMSAVCSHLDSVEITELPEHIEACEHCSARSGSGDNVTFVVET